MTSLYGVTRYFDYEYLERALYPSKHPPNDDDCSGKTSNRAGNPCGNLPPTVQGLAKWLYINSPSWFSLFRKAQMDYLLNNDLELRTLFLPPASSITQYQIEKWPFEQLRRLLSMLIMERPIPPKILARSRYYKLYPSKTYVPVYIYSPDGCRYFFQDPNTEILLSNSYLPPVQVKPAYPVHIMAMPYAKANTYHYVYHLSNLPPMECSLGVYAD